MNRSACLIFNPVSGQGNPKHDLQRIRQQLGPYFTLEIYLTTPESSTANLAQIAIAHPTELVIASGGDGTISAVAQALIATPKTLGIIPRGTANAFASGLDIPSNIPAACDVIIKGTPRRIDTAKCNNDRAMILLAGIGFEAETVERANRSAKTRWGVLAYILAGMQQLDRQELFETEIEIADEIFHLRVGAITIANVAPSTSVLAQGFGQAIPDDGLLEVTIGTADTNLQALDAIADLMAAAITQTPTHREDIIRLRTAQIKVATNPPQKVAIDGELAGTTPIEAKCIPRSLAVIVPAPALKEWVHVDPYNRGEDEIARSDWQL
jgi:YegS/Rv2252/BmrU family lipid kinase